MRDFYSVDQIHLMREATALASEIVGTPSEHEKADIANYVLSAYQAGLTDINDMARRASQQFLLWNFYDDQTMPSPL